MSRYDEGKFIAELCIQMEEMCFPFQEEQLGDLIVAIAQAKGHPNATCGRSFWRRFYKQHPQVEKYKTTGIDIKRAQAATEHVRDSVSFRSFPSAGPAAQQPPEWAEVSSPRSPHLLRRPDVALTRQVFGKLRALIDKLIFSGLWTQEDYATRLDELIYNMDEFGGGTKGKRSKVLGAKRGAGSDERGAWRRAVIQTGDDGQDPFHVTVLAIVRGSGELLPPVIIHSRPTKKTTGGAKKQRLRSKEMSENLPDDWGLLATSNGSMERDVFHLACQHFVRCLPSGFGPCTAAPFFCPK